MTKSDRKRLHTAVFVVAYTLAALIVAPFYFSWTGLLIGFILWFIPNHIGVGMGFHRLLTHDGYEVPKWLECTMTAIGCLSLQGSPTRWVAIHRQHHKYVEETGKDPHTPRDGKSWAQWLWMILRNPSIDEDTLIQTYAPKMAKDKFQVLAHHLWWIPSLIIGLVLLIVGWPNPSLFLWGAIVPVAVGWQITWLVNSVTHIWGSRRFDTNDDSTNSWWVAILTFGEGWHNNHHKYPRSARHGLAWYEFDLNYYSILVLSWLGLAKKLQLASLDE